MKAECTWGDGPDIVMDLDGKPMELLESPGPIGRFTYGVVSKGLIDLTAEEAEALGVELIGAAREVRQLRQICKDHDAHVETKKKMEWKNIK